jgi:cytochrome c-type biogenesis protein CcmH/NrfG
MSVAAEQLQPRSERAGVWLYGRWTDLLIGGGLAYVLSIPVLFALSEATGTNQWPGAFVVLFALLVNGPHYGATIVRVYDAREDRRKYVFFAVYATIVVAALFVASSRNVWLASVLITAYLTWSPWHFSGQNYGLTLMFLRRRGIDVDPLTKRLVYASFVLSALLAILAIHGGYEGLVFAPSTLHVANTPSILSFKLPAVLAGLLKGGAVLGYLGCLGATAWRLRRRGRLGDLAPAYLLVFTQALWFTVPAILFQWSAARTQTLVFSAIWVNAAHSIQYLWVTTYYAKSSDPRASAKGFLLKSLVAGTAVATVPGILMAPQLLGSIPWDAGLAATLFAVVNLHHFILDGAIWKLRDSRVGRVLLRAVDPADRVASAAPARGQRWARTLVWTLAALSLFVPLAEVYGKLALGRASRPEQIERSTQLLKWVGRETTEMHYWIGNSFSRQQDHTQAISQYQRSIELFPTARVWAALANEYRTLGQWGRARAAFEAAIELNPELAAAHFGRAQALLAVASGSSEPNLREEAAASLERTLEIWPGHSRAAVTLARLYTDTGRSDLALQTLERALAADKPSDPSAVRQELARLQP